MINTLANFIDGRFVEPAGGAYFDDIDPATGAGIARVPDSDERDVDTAVAAARRAFPGWSATPAAERSRMLLALAELIERDLDELARRECVDTGKPLLVAQSVDIPRAVANFRVFATAILHTQTEAHQTDTTALNITLRTPRGVAGLISPWNLPLYLFSWKVAPAIATGNTAVCKPSELTPLTAHRLAELCLEAELPPGVLNVVHGRGEKAGAAIVSHPDIPTISFTGGTDTGATIARTAAPMFKRLSLECGGKNPTIIFADADLDEALPTSVRAAFSNQGEICLAGSRLLVERPIYDRFVDDFVQRTGMLNVGDPLQKGTDLGALISAEHLAKVESYLALAQAEGGTIRCGGRRPPPEVVGQRCRRGNFLEPTVVTGLDAGDILSAALSRSHAGEEQQVADTFGVRVGAHRLGCAMADQVGIVGHDRQLPSLMHTFLGSVKNRSASWPPSRPRPLAFIPPKGTRRSRSIQQFTHTVPDSNRSATWCARSSRVVHNEAERP